MTEVQARGLMQSPRPCTRRHGDSSGAWLNLAACRFSFMVINMRRVHMVAHGSQTGDLHKH